MSDTHYNLTKKALVQGEPVESGVYTNTAESFGGRAVATIQIVGFSFPSSSPYDEIKFLEIPGEPGPIDPPPTDPFEYMNWIESHGYNPPDQPGHTNYLWVPSQLVPTPIYEYHAVSWTHWEMGISGGGLGGGGFAYTRRKWNGVDWDAPVDFVKTNYGSEIDSITPLVQITRGNSKGIYNPLEEPGWDETLEDSPKLTAWTEIDFGGGGDPEIVKRWWADISVGAHDGTAAAVSMNGWANPSPGDSFTINWDGSAYTFVAGTDFVIGGDDSATAYNMIQAINNHPTLGQYVEAQGVV